MTQPPFDAYAIYCAHQRERGQPEPSREWWDKSVSMNRNQVRTKQNDLDFDVETERREGWGYE